MSVLQSHIWLPGAALSNPLCPYDRIATSLPRRSLWDGDGQTNRYVCGIPRARSRHSDYNSLCLSFWVNIGSCWWRWVCYCWGDRVSSLYCVEGHRFNLIMPEKPCSLCSHHSSHSSTSEKHRSMLRQTIGHPRQNRWSAACWQRVTLISGVNIDCGREHCL